MYTFCISMLFLSTRQNDRHIVLALRHIQKWQFVESISRAVKLNTLYIDFVFAVEASGSKAEIYSGTSLV